MATTKTTAARPAEDLHWIRAADLQPWPGLNPRRRFDADALRELAESIREDGVREPILVHDRGYDFDTGGRYGKTLGPRYWIVAGERRWRAASEVGPDTSIPCMVRVYAEEEAVRIALVENLNRADMSPVEEARGLQRLIEVAKVTQAEAGRRVGGRDQSWVSNRVRLLKLPDEILQLVEDGVLEVSHARDYLLPFANIPEVKRKQLFAKVAKDIAGAQRKEGERLAAPALFRLVAAVAVKLSRQVHPHETVYGVDKDAPLFDPKEHQKCTCQGPRYHYRGYFGGERDHARCFDDAWWQTAQDAARERLEAERLESIAAASVVTEDAQDGPVVIPRETFNSTYTYNDYRQIGTSSAGPGQGEGVDPSLLPPESLRLVGERRGDIDVDLDDEDDRGEAVIVLMCVNRAAVEEVEKARDKEVKRRQAELAAARTARDLEEAAKTQLEPWMLAEILTARPQNDTLLAVGRELKIDVGKHGELHDRIRKLPAEDVALLFKVLALRARRGELSYTDPLERQAKREYRDRVCVELRRFFPGMEVKKPWSTLREDFAGYKDRVDQLVRDIRAAQKAGTTTELLVIHLDDAVRRAKELRNEWWELSGEYAWWLTEGERLLEELQPAEDEEAAHAA